MTKTNGAQRFESLPVGLTPAEVAVKADEHARKRKDFERLTEEKKDAVRRFGEQLKTLDAEITQLATEVKDRSERREVPVRDSHDYASGTVRTIRMDTGEVVRARAMTAAERQRDMFTTQDEAPAPKAAKSDKPTEKPKPTRKRKTGSKPTAKGKPARKKAAPKSKREGGGSTAAQASKQKESDAKPNLRAVT